ncbi:MAG: hypothetical protein ACKO8O_17730 [Betaproteobacteria bacterium]
MRVTAPIAQAQLVESRILNLIHAHSVMATKAERCVLAAPGSRLIEFGLRRAHGAEAAMIASHAAVLAGFDATANLVAGLRDGLSLAGTMAHSYVLAHEAEAIAFEQFGHANPGNVAFVIDTYDTEQGAHRAVAAAHELSRSGIRLQAVRIDSGDLSLMSRRVRMILDSAGLQQVRILVSGDLDEWRIAALRAAMRRLMRSVSEPRSRHRPMRPRWTWRTSWLSTTAGHAASTRLENPPCLGASRCGGNIMLTD